VRLCAALGKTQEMTSALVGVGYETLMKNYREDLAYGRQHVELAVAGKLVSAATQKEHTGPSISAAQFWARTQMGFREASVVEVHKAPGDTALTVGMTQAEAVRAYLDALRVINVPPTVPAIGPPAEAAPAVKSDE